MAQATIHVLPRPYQAWIENGLLNPPGYVKHEVILDELDKFLPVGPDITNVSHLDMREYRDKVSETVDVDGNPVKLPDIVVFITRNNKPVSYESCLYKPGVKIDFRGPLTVIGGVVTHQPEAYMPYMQEG